MSRFVPAPRPRRGLRPALTALGLSAGLITGIIAGSIAGAAAAEEAARPEGASENSFGAQTLTLDQARTLAVRAAFGGEPRLAAALAYRLLQNDPNDASALLAMSALHLSVGEAREAYRAGRRAFRFAQDKELKYHAARMAATAAAAEKRTIPTQFWLRRAGDVAPSPVARAAVKRNYQVFQAQNPWRWRLDMSVTPSSNVNGGAEGAYNIIEGVPLVGVLSPEARALGGTIAQSRLDLSYKLAGDAQSRTALTASVYAKRVWLNADARAAAPAFDPSTLSAEQLSLGLRHTRKAGKGGAIMQYSAGLTTYRQGGDKTHDALTGSLVLSRPLGETLRFTGLIGAEAQRYAAGGNGQVLRAQAGLSWKPAGGGELSGVIHFSQTDAPIAAFDSRAWFGRLSYALPRPIVGTRLSASIGASRTDFPGYALGFIPVPGGRQDEAVFLDLDATFEQVEFAGFSPSLRIRRQSTTSNVSRFTTSEWAVSVGISSNF